MERSQSVDGAGTVRRMARSLLGTGSFRPLVAVHVITSAANAMFTVSLAESLFFGVSVDAARPRVLFYLLLTMAPFAIVAPLLGPFTDRVRGGYRNAIVITAVGRAVACGLLVAHLDTLLLFPEAFAVLVLGKTYSVAKSALVPRLVDEPDQFVAANARLARASSIGAVVAGGIGALVLQLAGGFAVAGLAAVLHLVAGVVALTIRAPDLPPQQPGIIAELELHSARLTRSAAALSVVRFAAGYMAFMIAIDLKTTSAPAWVFGMVLLAGAVGSFLGSVAAGPLRANVNEERLIAGALLLPGAVALLAGIQYGWASDALVAAAVGFAAMVGIHSFDSLAQQLAPDAEKGRAFARFETRFQLAWVFGATGPVLFRPPAFVGFLVLGGLLVAAFFAYAAALRLPASALADPITLSSDRSPAADLLALGGALQARGSHRLAVLVAVEAGRVARQAGSQPPGDVLERLEAMWRNAATEQVVSLAESERAIALVSELLDHSEDRTRHDEADGSGTSTAVHSSSTDVTENRTSVPPPDDR